MKTYLTDWPKQPSQQNSQKSNAETLRIAALEPEWDLAQGWHPDIEVDNSFYDSQLRRPLAVKQVPHMPRLVETTPEGAVTGHVMLKDSGYPAIAQPDKNAPILPLFIRDLAGRIVYIGTTRHKQTTKEGAAAACMPFGSVLVTEEMEGYNLLERVFFSCFRFVEMSDKYVGRVAGGSSLMASLTYFAPNLYPYKLRLDTFYQDGWRLPQTERLFVYPTADPAQAERASAAFVTLWQEKPENQTYEAFVEAHETEITDFFKRGCTLIPTIEAYNGINKVDDDFNHKGFWPGRAVVGLHDIVAHEPSDAPQGTILKVLEPGFVTEKTLHPARVIVSDGADYRDKEGARYTKPRPTRLFPNLRLPHQRLSAKWGAAWLPQHPADFEEPALWGWEEASSGRFVQLRGPVWDPLHYYYACTPKVIESFKKNRLRQNVNLVKIPKEMLERFYPVVEFVGFDSFNIPKKKQEAYTASLLPTTIFHHKDASCLCGIGYHPMPIPFDYELDNWWFPDLAPKRRVSDVIPLNVEKKLVEVIHPNIPPDRFSATLIGDNDNAPWATDPLLLASLRENILENYPYLKRYLEPDVSDEEVLSLALPFLNEREDLPAPLNSLPTPIVRAMEANWPGLYQAFLGVSRKAQQIEAFRHTLYTEDFSGYMAAFWNMTPLEELFDRAEETKDPKKNLPNAAVTGAAEY